MISFYGFQRFVVIRCLEIMIYIAVFRTSVGTNVFRCAVYLNKFFINGLGNCCTLSVMGVVTKNVHKSHMIVIAKRFPNLVLGSDFIVCVLLFFVCLRSVRRRRPPCAMVFGSKRRARSFSVMNFASTSDG